MYFRNVPLKKTLYFFSCSISLIRNCEKLPAQDHFIVQEYLDKPFLMEGYKFDLRIYILVTSCDPLRIFLYNDGLVRMGTEKYHTPNESNLVRMPCIIKTVLIFGLMFPSSSSLLSYTPSDIWYCHQLYRTQECLMEIWLLSEDHLDTIIVWYEVWPQPCK